MEVDGQDKREKEKMGSSEFSQITRHRVNVP
jgi:hypothetical protein